MANEFTMKLFGCQSTGANGFFAAFKKAEMESFATEINTCSPFLSRLHPVYAFVSAGIVATTFGVAVVLASGGVTYFFPAVIVSFAIFMIYIRIRHFSFHVKESEPVCPVENSRNVDDAVSAIANRSGYGSFTRFVRQSGCYGIFEFIERAKRNYFAVSPATNAPFFSSCIPVYATASAGIVCRKVGLCAFKPSPFSRLGIVVENGLQIGLGDKFGFSQRSAPSDRG